MVLEIVEERLESGRVVGAFELQRTLGEGGMGVVWAARDTTTGRPVALKFLRSDREIDDKDRMRFLREARAAMAVSHPHIAKVHAVLETEAGVPFLVMDLLEGESLRAILRRRGALTVAECARVFIPIASAVEAAHALGIVHRDLKPENVFLVNGHDVRVLDFGIAKQMPKGGDATSSASLTSTGAVLGTPQYMAPEQVFGADDLDARADAWAIGVMLFECLAGRRPIDGVGFGPILKGITVDPIPPLRFAHGGDVPEVIELVQRLLSRNKVTRPALSHVRSVLERASGMDVPTQLASPRIAVPPGRPPTTTAAVASKRPLQETTTRTRSRVPIVLTVVVATALTAGVAVTAARYSRGRPSPATSVLPEAAAAPPLAVADVGDAGEATLVATEDDAGGVRHVATGGTSAAPDADERPGPHLKAAEDARSRGDGATCIRELDTYDRLQKDPAFRSAEPGSAHGQTRSLCLMMSGNCEAGKALFRRLAVNRGRSDADNDLAADGMAWRYCTGAVSTRDEVGRSSKALGSAASGMRKATPAQCMQWYRNVRDLSPGLQPKAPGDEIKLMPMRLMTEGPSCLARAGDCAGSLQVFREQFARNRPAPHNEDDIRSEYALIANQTRSCKGAP